MRRWKLSSRLAVLCAAFGLAACSTASVTRGEPPLANPARDAAVQFLLTSAASDFHAHRPPDPVRFRDVRVGHVVLPDGEAQYRLCGQFLPAQEGGKAEWTSFATIKTSGYEQWLGGPSTSYCQGPTFTWDQVNDLSAALQSQFESLR